GRTPGAQSAAGTVTGKVHFAIEKGYLSLVKLRVASEGGDGDIAVSHAIEVSLTRVPGNTACIIPDNPVEYELAIPFLQRKDFDGAIPFLKKTIELNPKLVRALCDLGFAYNEKRLYDQAIPCFIKVIELEPNHTVAHNNLGTAYNEK